MQQKANVYASEQMVGWVEEVHKGLQGLELDDPGRLVAARFGLSWGLIDVMKVQRGVLLESENHQIARVTETVGIDSNWSRLCLTAFGIQSASDLPSTLHDEVRAGLQLYVETATLLAGIIRPQDQELIQSTVARIRDAR